MHQSHLALNVLAVDCSIQLDMMERNYVETAVQWRYDDLPGSVRGGVEGARFLAAALVLHELDRSVPFVRVLDTRGIASTLAEREHIDVREVVRP